MDLALIASILVGFLAIILIARGLMGKDMTIRLSTDNMTPQQAVVARVMAGVAALVILVCVFLFHMDTQSSGIIGFVLIMLTVVVGTFLYRRFAPKK
jgi:hypothetical protein